MLLDSDVVLLGTGVAPLIAANHLLTQGKSVLLLNPDLDFFLEDSELSLDPLQGAALKTERILRSTPQQSLSVLRPDFPGPLEFWTSQHQHKGGFHDPSAPHLRERDRIWICASDSSSKDYWNALENLYVEAEDSDLKPQILEGYAALRKFPGISSQGGQAGDFRALLIPKLCDIDLMRYRIGLMEFIRERLGSKNVICAVNDLDATPDGIRFRVRKNLHNVRVGIGILVFWTPRLNNWIAHQSRIFEKTPPAPLGIRLWEEWSVISRTPPYAQAIGNYNDLSVWADYEGPPESEKNQRFRLSVLRSGQLITKTHENQFDKGTNWASAPSFYSLANLTQDFLKWGHTTIRGMKPRAIFEWKDDHSWTLCSSSPRIEIIKGCDGPLMNVVRVAKNSCERLLSEEK